MEIIMKISEIAALLEAEILCCEEYADHEVNSACGSDMMSDVLAFVKDQAVLLTGLVHDGKSASYLSAVAAALSLNKVKSSISVLQIGAIGIGIAFAAAFSFIAGGAELSVVPLVITQAVFTVIGFISTKSKTRNNKK